MADFGDLALAFAGGAAKQINEDVAAERNSRLRTQERMKEMQLQQRIRQQESEYTSRMKVWEQEQKHIQALKSMGDDQLAQQQYIATQIQGRDLESIRQRVKNGGEVPVFTWSPTITTRPKYQAMTEEDYNHLGKTESSLRKMLGVEDRVEPVPVPRVAGEDDPQPTGELLKFGGGEADWKLLLERSSDKTQIIVGEDGIARLMSLRTGTQIGEGVDTGTKAANKITIQKQGERLGELLGKGTLTEAETLEVQALRRELSGDPEKSPWKAHVSTETGNTIWTNVNTQERVEVPGTLATEDEAKDSLIRFQNERETLVTKIDEGTDVDANQQRLREVNAMITKLTTITGTTPDDPAARSKRFVDQMKNRLGTTESALENVAELRRVSKASAGGLPGILSVGVDIAATNMRGIAEATGFVSEKTSEQRRAEVLEMDPEFDKYLDENLAAFRGANKVVLTNLIYDIAGVMRETGRRDISNADIERAKSIMSGLMSSDTEEGTLIQLEKQITRRRRNIARDLYMEPGVDTTEQRTFGRQLLKASEFKPGSYYWDSSRGDYVVSIGKDANGVDIPRTLKGLVNQGVFD